MQILKGTLILPFLLALTITASAQKQKAVTPPVQQGSFLRCGTQAVLDEYLKKHPDARQRIELNRKQIVAAYEQLKLTLRPYAIYTIPVVVHVVLLNPSLVTDAQIQSQIDVLNEDFAGLNADSTRIPAAFKPLYGKGNLRFCLARRDTRGDATNGIVRITSSVISIPGLSDPVKFTCNGGSDAWDPTKYLNIWVSQMPTGFLGYSFFAADPLAEKPLIERGFVNSFRSFGRGGTAQAPFNLGRTATHEIGHFFDLNHIWGPNNCDGTQSCTDDDGMNDTPKQFKCTFGAPPADSVIIDACTTTAPGIMWMNYMDYVDDRAMLMYTPQQYNRMEAILLANPWMQTLATSNGCTAVTTFNRDVRFEKFRDPFYELCGNTSSLIFSCSSAYKPVITIKNVGTTTITSLTITASFGAGSAVVTNWTGNLAPQATVDIILNTMTLNPGTNANFIVYTSNPNGIADQKPVNDTGRVAGIVYPLVTLPYSEGFESPTFPPNNWQRINPDAGITWQRTSTAAKTGNASMFINNFDYNVNGSIDWMFSPLIPVKGKDSAFLVFQVAAATFNMPDLANNPTDTLEVLVTSNCGLTYTSVYKKWGKELVTTGNIATDHFFIPTATQWRKDSVLLGDFSNGNTENIQAVIRNITNYENNIYIDDIQLFTKNVNPNLKAKGLLAVPNPFQDKFYLQHYPGVLNIEYIHVYNHMGQLVWQRKIALGQPGTMFGPNNFEVDLTGLSSGVYTVQIVYRARTTQTIKVVKVN